MSLVTILWSMASAAALTLGVVHAMVFASNRTSWPSLWFAVAAVSMAAYPFFDLAMMHAQSGDAFGAAARWALLPISLMIIATLLLVHSYFGTGLRWLLVAALAARTVALMVNLMCGHGLFFETVADVRVVRFLGETVSAPVGGVGRMLWVEHVAALVWIGYIVNASWRLWRKGGAEARRRVVMIGGSIVVILTLGLAQATLVVAQVIDLPVAVTVTFLALLMVMGCELSRDVLRAAKLSRELHESERRMDLAASAAMLGFWTWDIARDEIWASDTARRLFEIPAEEKIDLARFVAALHPEDRAGVGQAITTALGGGMEYETEYRVMLRCGGERWIAARGRVEIGSNGRPELMRGLLLAITGRRESETELQQVRGQLAHAGRVSMMGQLASALAHELNQPLGAILRNAEAAELFMQEASPNLDEVRAIIGDIKRDDQRAGEVIDRLRALLKRRDIESKPLSIGQLLDEVLALTRADAAARGVKLETACDPGLPMVRGDRVHLQQVLINLIINGMDALGDASRSERRVTVSARNDGPGFVEVMVSDTGHGIPQEKLNQVFDPFFTTKAHGMGMGLPISRTIIEAHGGRITAENAPGGGAVFRFTLPVEDGAER